MEKSEKEVENELKKILVQFSVKEFKEENIVGWNIHTDISLDDSQLRKLLSLGHVNMKRSGKGITIRLTKIKTS